MYPIAVNQTEEAGIMKQFNITVDELSQYYRNLTNKTDQYVDAVNALFQGMVELRESWAFDQDPQINLIVERLGVARELYPALYALLDQLKQRIETYQAADMRE